MNRHLHFTTELFRNSAFAVLIVFATTFFLLLVGRNEVGESVLALVYLVPVIWSGYRWGQGPGMVAALAAGLCFDFLFIPPFYTFTIGSLEGWLVLAIFLAVAVLLVGRFEASLARAQKTTFMYELSSVLSNTRTQDAVAHTLARFIQQLFQVSQVNVIYQPSRGSPKVVVSETRNGGGKARPDRVLPILNAWGLVGEIQIWRGEFGKLPTEDDLLLQNFASQAAQALERSQQIENEEIRRGLNSKAPAK